MPDARYDAAVAAARHILAMAGIPATPDRLGRVAFAVLEAIYQAESRLAERPRPLLCGSCLLALPPGPGEAGRPCPRCGRRMCPAEGVGRN